ncbi:MAG: ABC transporter substrate-binding protein [Cyanobacteria bacterium P01_D01_bin.1]
MKRRDIAKQAATASAIGLAAGACGRAPQPERLALQTDSDTVRWRMATSWPKSLDITFGTVEVFCRTLSNLTQGKFVIIPYESGEISPGLEVLDAVMAGTAECGHTSSHYYLAKQPALAFSAVLPFGLNAQQRNAWLLTGGGLALIRQVFDKLGVINFPAGNTGPQMGGWFKRAIASTDDLKGVRMRIPGLGGEIMSRLGVEVKNLAADAIVGALVADELDAVEWIGPHDDEKLGLDQVASYYYYPGWWSPAETMDLIVSLDLWNQLPSRYQAAFQAAAALVNQSMLARYNAANSKAIERIKSKGVQVESYTADILQTAQQVATELYAEMADDSADFAQIYTSWQDFRQRIQQWHAVNKASFANFVYANSPLETAKIPT